MEKARVLVVDDSLFSQMAISGMLRESGFEVCHCAAAGQEAVNKYRELQPDLVTMDYTLPDIDGLNCSRQILTINPEAQIIILSAMKDDKLVAKGKALGIRAFLQKPVERETLAETLYSINNQDKVFDDWQDKYLEYFETALRGKLRAMVSVEAETMCERSEKAKFIAHGVAIIVGITGTRHGRIILDVSPVTLTNLVQAMLHKKDVSENDMLNSIAELANIIAGAGVSAINNKHKNVELRLTPPSILLGEELSVINQRMKSSTIVAKAAVGNIYLNIGFTGGQ